MEKSSTKSQTGETDMNPRRTGLKIKIKEKDRTKDVLPYLSDFSHTDNASNESDTVSITLGDKDKKWTGAWMPAKGDNIEAEIHCYNYKKQGDHRKMNCGHFCIDDIGASGNPRTLTIGAVSGPILGFKATNRTKVWKKTTIKGILKQIAKRYNRKAFYNAATIKIASIEQSGTSDAGFLQNLAATYGLFFKAYKDKLVMYDKERYKAKKTVHIIDLKNVENWNWDDNLIGAYTGGSIPFKSGKKTKRLIMGSGKRMYNLSDEANSESEAKRKLKAAITLAYEERTTLDFNIVGDPSFVAGQTIAVKGESNKINGKYFVKQVEHSLSASSGYTASVSCFKVYTFTAKKVRIKTIKTNSGSTQKNGSMTITKPKTSKKWGCPLRGTYYVTSKYLERRTYELHPGIDLAGGSGGQSGCGIYASAAGTVSFTGRYGGYGYAVMINHGGGITSLYGHMPAGGIKVRKGQSVNRGERIGTVDSTGWSSGAHLHFEIRKNGHHVNPSNYYNVYKGRGYKGYAG